MHNYYSQSDLLVYRNSDLIGSYSDIMSSSSLPGGGEARNTDYFYHFDLAGLTTGDQLTFQLTNLQNLGSAWANIAFLSSSLNYVVPDVISQNYKNLDGILITPAAVPEPSSLLLLLLGITAGGGCAFWNRRRN